MSFAEPWLRYIEEKSKEYSLKFRINYVIIKGPTPKETSFTEIAQDKKRMGALRQYFKYKKNIQIPDTLGINPIDAVEIGISEGITFHMTKDKNMIINFARRYFPGEGISPVYILALEYAAKKCCVNQT